MLTKDVEIKDDAPKTILLDKHAKYLVDYSQDEQNFEKILAEYLKMSGIYWSFTAMDLIGKLDSIGTLKKKLLGCVQFTKFAR